MDDTHNERVVAEFTKQAELYAAAPELNDKKALDLLCEMAGVCHADTVLDVACGPGVVACHIAKTARHVTGVDLTPAMIEKAQRLQADQGLSNVCWRVGDIAALPFSDGIFSLVLSRYAFHHIDEPRAVLREMCRVCTSTARFAIADVCLPNDKQMVQTFNRFEQLRDPSHVHAFSAGEFRALFDEMGLAECKVSQYRIEFELEYLLAGSFATGEAKDAIRNEVRRSLESDQLGMVPYLRGDDIWVSYPISVFVLSAR